MPCRLPKCWFVIIYDTLNKEAPYCCTASLVLAVSLLLLIPNPAFAFSVGNIDVHSVFGERFQAEIPLKLRLYEVNQAVELRVEDSSVYHRLKLSYPWVITHLKTRIEGKAQDRRMVVYSEVPFRIPFFNLLLKTSVGMGSYTRNYPILLEMAQLHKKPTLDPSIRPALSPQQKPPTRREGPSSQPKKRPIQSQHTESIPPPVAPDYDLHLTVAEEQGLPAYSSNMVAVSDDSLSLHDQLASLQKRLKQLEQQSALSLQPKEEPVTVSQPIHPPRPVVSPREGFSDPPPSGKLSEWLPWIWYGLSGLSGFMLAGFLAWLSRKKMGRTGYQPQAEAPLNRPPEMDEATRPSDKEPFIPETFAFQTIEAEKKWGRPQEKLPPENAQSIEMLEFVIDREKT